MNSDVLIAFSIFQLTFLFLDIYILMKTSRDIARKGEYLWFSSLVVTHVLYLILNSIWSLNEYDVLKIDRTVLTVICTGSLWTVTNCAAAFFLFVTEKLKLTPLQSGAGVWLRQLPAMISTVLIASSPWTGWVFRLDESGYVVHGTLYLPMMVISSLYLFAVAAVAMRNILVKRSTFFRKANGALLISVLIIILFIVADGLLLKASILPVAIFAVILIIFISMQEANINSDALTGMNNRRKAEEYLSELLTNVSEMDPVYLYIGDLNCFKRINDTYGHIEGDEALILCSRALRRAAAQLDGFTARFGGDEFLLAWHPGKGKDVDPETMIGLVEQEMERHSAEKPYKLDMAVGYVRCTDPKVQLNAYIGQADAMLYQKKTTIQAR